MQVRYFYRHEGKEKLIRCGHYLPQEIEQLLQDGWKESLSRKSRKPQNKNGIGIQVASTLERKREMQR